MRIIAATNQELEKAIREGRFREDLLYRINTFTITLPPLRERLEDIPALAEHFLKRAQAKVNKKVNSISPRALTRCCGIIPGLEISVSWRILLSGRLCWRLRRRSRPNTCPCMFRTAPHLNRKMALWGGESLAIERFERDALSSYLREAQGNISKAALLANIPRRTFHRLMLKHRISSARTSKPRDK